jgi:hypothetical protein
VYLHFYLNPLSNPHQKDLNHPPLTSVGNDYAFRTADGHGNNPSYPALGRAGTNYARSVQGTNPLPRHSLPDPGLIFDTLLRRDKVGWSLSVVAEGSQLVFSLSRIQLVFPV